MPAPFDDAAYVLMRAYVLSTWHYIALLDQNDREIARINYASDPRCSVAQNAATGEIAITVRLRGDDPDINPHRPLRIKGSRLYRDAADGDPLHPSSIDPARLVEAGDGIVYTHHLFLPFPTLS